MFNTLKKTSLALLVASTALVQMSCNKDDDEEKRGNWFRKDLPNFGGSIRTNAVSFVIGSVGYIGTGYTTETVARVKDFWAYNAERQTWSQITPFPGSGRNSATAFVLKGKAYVGGGFDGVTGAADGGYKKDFYEYDPATNKWAAIADFGGGTRQFATSFVVNDRAYVGLGYNGSNYYQDFYEYNPTTDKWAEMATFKGGKRSGAMSFTIGTKAYVGFGDSNSQTAYKDMYSFDPAGNGGAGNWTRVDFADGFDQDAFPARSYGATFVIDGKAYVVGGKGRSDVWEYDPGANSWIERAPFATQRGFAGAFVVGKIGYLGTGSASGSGVGSDDFWGFDPSQAIDTDDDL